MSYLFCSVKSDFIKIKRKPILIIHGLLPLLGIIIFLMYFSYTPWKNSSKVFMFLQMTAFSFPLLIGIVSSLIVEQEALSASFYEMLTSHIKLMPFLSKLVVIFLLGFTSMLVLVCGFGLGFSYVLKQSPFAFKYYIYAACILFFSSIFIYILHMIISMKFGSTLSIGIGVLESLSSAILATDLGLGRWEFIPCTWPMRFMIGFHKFMVKSHSFLEERQELHLAIFICILATIGIFIFSSLWFLKWEGRENE